MKQNPNDPAALRTLNMAQFRAGKFTESFESFKHRSSLGIKPQPLDFFVQAMAMHRLGNALAPRFLAIGVSLMHRLYNPKDPETLRVMEEAKELLGI